MVDSMGEKELTKREGDIKEGLEEMEGERPRKEWVSSKWKEIIRTLEKEKESLEEENKALRERAQGSKGSPKDKERELQAKRKEQEYAILLSETTRLRNELDKALMVNKPLAIKIEQATHEIRALREHNKDYRKHIIELKVEIGRLQKESSVEDDEQVKDLVAVLEGRVKNLESKNAQLKDQLHQTATKRPSKPRFA